LDPLTETYGVGFYLQYLARWPEYFLVAESPGGDLMGYIMGKAEGKYNSYTYQKNITLFILFRGREPFDL
jgi:N-terminal acetyltransferase B complex catalytic subunit